MNYFNLFQLSFDNLKSLNDANFKLLLKRLVQFYKPSSKKYSHTPLKFETSRINIYTLVACDLFNILLDSRIVSTYINDVKIQPL